MQTAEREAVILNLLSQQSGYLAFHDMEKQVQTSSATLRRDLQRMAREGRITRVRGGAKLAAETQGAASIPTRLAGVPFRDNISRSRRQKEAIGRAAAALCVPETMLMIDSGTTTLQMCRHLAGLKLQVMTNSLHIVTALLLQTGTRVLVPSGVVFAEQNIILSPENDAKLPLAPVPQLFMGAAAVGAQGVMQADPFLGAAQRRLVERAQEIILLVDSSKFQGSGNIVCDLKEIDVVVTDRGITDRDMALLKAADIKVVIAK